MGFLTADLQRKVQSRAIVSQPYSRGPPSPPTPPTYTPPAGYITDEGPQPSEWTVLSLIHWQDVQGPFSLFISTAAESQHPDPVISPPPPPHVLTLSPCALACFWCGVEARLVHTSHPVLCSCGFVPRAGRLLPSGDWAGAHTAWKMAVVFFIFILFLGFFLFYRNYVFVT